MSGPIVIKLGGAAIDAPHLPPAIAPCASSVGSQGVILVHGGGATVDRQFDRLGMGVQKRDGLRVTTEEQIDDVVAVIAGVVGATLCAKLSAAGVPAIGLTLGSAGMDCEILDPARGLGRVGRVRGVRDDRLAALLDAGLLPVIACVGDDGAGGMLNINGDDAAAGVASSVGASSLILLTDVPGVLDAGGSLISSLDEADAERLIESGVIAGGMTPKVRGALEASARSGAPVVIASWKDSTVFERLGAGEPVGTSVLAQPRHTVFKEVIGDA